MLPAPGDLKNFLDIYQNIRRADLIRHRTQELGREYTRCHPGDAA